jgi:Rrf2 family protein
VFSRTAEYAIRAVLVLARNVGKPPLNAEEIASMLGAPRNYLGKTLNTLVRHGLLSSIRGPHGGFALAVAPDVLSVADIIELFAEQKLTPSMCVLANRPCNPEKPCEAHERWVEVTVRAREPLARTKISELCGTDHLSPNVPAADHAGATAAKVGRILIPTGTKS